MLMLCHKCNRVHPDSLNCPSCKKLIEEHNVKICRCSGKPIPKNNSKELIQASELWVILSDKHYAVVK